MGNTVQSREKYYKEACAENIRTLDVLSSPEFFEQRNNFKEYSRKLNNAAAKKDNRKN